MNTRLAGFLSLLLLLLFTVSGEAQSTFQFGALPSFNVNKKLKNNWYFNGKLESRQLFQQGEIGGNIDKSYTYVLTDLSVIAAKKVGLNSRIAGGYLSRFEDGALIHRFIQQYVIIQRLYGFRLAHRLMTDQTFSPVEDTELRLRYRITSEIPLNGASLDPKEFYLKVNNEYVNGVQGSEYDLEVRIVPLLGYDITDDFKIESGLDYRVNSFVNSHPRHTYWLTFNVFLEL